MDVQFTGTGGPAGWPQAGCRCASCMRAAAAPRRPGRVVVDGVLALDPGQAPRPAPGYRIEPLPGGWDITAPGGDRLLVASGPGSVPEPFSETRPFDLALLDLLAAPAQLGALRARGLVRDDTVTAALFADHRVSSERELARRCLLWQAVLPADGQTLSSGAEPVAGPTLPHRTLVLGGARSGKSREAELRLAAQPQVTYLAAGPYPDGATPQDAEWARRVAAHQAARPAWWQTIESTDVAGALRRLTGVVLVDGIGTWLTAVMTEAGAWDESASDESASDDKAVDDTGDPTVAGRISDRVADLVAAWRQTRALVVAVSDQVGSGVVPATRAGRRFRDELGWLNQRLAAESEETVLVVAGQPLALST